MDRNEQLAAIRARSESQDAEFITHARADIEWLLYEVDRLSSGWNPND